MFQCKQSPKINLTTRVSCRRLKLFLDNFCKKGSPICEHPTEVRTVNITRCCNALKFSVQVLWSYLKKYLVRCNVSSLSVSVGLHHPSQLQHRRPFKHFSNQIQTDFFSTTVSTGFDFRAAKEDNIRCCEARGKGKEEKEKEEVIKLNLIIIIHSFELGLSPNWPVLNVQGESKRQERNQRKVWQGRTRHWI